MAFPKLNLASPISKLMAPVQQQKAALDPRVTQIGVEKSNAEAALNTQSEEENLAEKNAFTASQNAVLLNRGPRPVGGGTYAELRRRKLGPKGIQMSGLGAANRQALRAARQAQIDTAAKGERTLINQQYGLNAGGTPKAGGTGIPAGANLATFRAAQVRMN